MPKSLQYCSDTDFVMCHDGMTNSIQKGWKQLKYWIPHTLVSPPLNNLRKRDVCILKVLVRRELSFFRSDKRERRKCCSASWSLLLTDFFHFHPFYKSVVDLVCSLSFFMCLLRAGFSINCMEEALSGISSSANASFSSISFFCSVFNV